VTRGVIELEPVTFELKDGGIGYISVNEFSRDVGADVNDAIATLRRDSGGRPVRARCSTCARTPAARSTRRWRSATCS
jgi:hypothetical protein